MIQIRVDLYVHNPEESRLEQKVNEILERVKALGTDPTKLAALAAELNAETKKLDDAIKVNPVPTP